MFTPIKTRGFSPWMDKGQGLHRWSWSLHTQGNAFLLKQNPQDLFFTDWSNLQGVLCVAFLKIHCVQTVALTKSSVTEVQVKVSVDVKSKKRSLERQKAVWNSACSPRAVAKQRLTYFFLIPGGWLKLRLAHIYNRWVTPLRIRTVPTTTSTFNETPRDPGSVPSFLLQIKENIPLFS